MNAKDAWMKQVKHNRKRLKGLPRVGFNPNAGNVEHNISMFNTMNSPTGGPSTNPCGPMGEALIEGMSREQMIAQLRELKCNYNFNDRKRFPDNVLWGILQDRLNKAQTKKINIKSKEISQEEIPEEDEPMEIKHCNRCGKQLTDFGQCPVCDLGDEDARESHTIYAQDIAYDEGYELNKSLNEMIEVKTYKGYEMRADYDVDAEEGITSLIVHIYKNGKEVRQDEFGKELTFGNFREARKWVDAHSSKCSLPDKLKQFCSIMNKKLEGDPELSVDKDEYGYYISQVDKYYNEEYGRIYFKDDYSYDYVYYHDADIDWYEVAEYFADNPEVGIKLKRDEDGNSIGIEEAPELYDLRTNYFIPFDSSPLSSGAEFDGGLEALISISDWVFGESLTDDEKEKLLDPYDCSVSVDESLNEGRNNPYFTPYGYRDAAKVLNRTAPEYYWHLKEIEMDRGDGIKLANYALKKGMPVMLDKKSEPDYPEFYLKDGSSEYYWNDYFYPYGTTTDATDFVPYEGNIDILNIEKNDNEVNEALNENTSNIDIIKNKWDEDQDEFGSIDDERIYSTIAKYFNADDIECWYWKEDYSGDRPAVLVIETTDSTEYFEEHNGNLYEVDLSDNEDYDDDIDESYLGEDFEDDGSNEDIDVNCEGCAKLMKAPAGSEGPYYCPDCVPTQKKESFIIMGKDDQGFKYYNIDNDTWSVNIDDGKRYDSLDIAHHDFYEITPKYRDKFKRIFVPTFED